MKKETIGRPRPVPTSDDADYDILADVTTPTKMGWWRPLHPLFVLAMLPLLPKWLFLNRGFTQWLHWGFLVYLVTGRNEWWGRFLVLQGSGVCAGWYSAVAFEYFSYNQLCHLLYNNMPSAFKGVYLTNGQLASGGIIVDTAPALACLALTHMIDLLAHPLLTYAIWKMHKAQGGTFRSLVGWDILATTYIWSRFYSFVHLYHNDGIIGFYYNGYDIYHIDNADSYTAAYIGEAFLYLCLIGYKLYLQSGKYLRLKVRLGTSARRSRRSSRKGLSPKQIAALSIEDKQKPKLVQSESCFSEASIPVES